MMKISKEKIWKTLEQLAVTISNNRMSDMFANDPERAKIFSLQVNDIYLDYSKNFLNNEIKEQLVALAHACDLPLAIQQLMSGECVNVTEKRPALHSALRQDPSQMLVVNQQDVNALVLSEKEKMYQFVNKLQQGKWLGATGKPITDIVNLGIGGSDLGPVMAVEALKPYQQSSLNIHFVSNIDPTEITVLLERLDPSTTLFIISSKSFSTTETLTNALVAKNWLYNSLAVGEKSSHHHFIAVTANPMRAKEFGVNPDNILGFWEWVGGRYSIWSTIGLPLALSIGPTHFEEFLLGARVMDEHFKKADLSQNMPVLLGLIGVWYINFWHANTLAVLPYSSGLRRLADYLQQLDMESNGKSVQRSGEPVDYQTGPIVWGQAGTNGQHAFYQLLHQGTHFIPVDFIVASTTHTSLKAQHQELIANCLAQSAALMMGSESSASHMNHDTMPGNKPSNTLLLQQLTPRALGQLLALYEHKVFVQGVIWQINSFDQPGVELGKKLAINVMKHLQGEILNTSIDSSTKALIERIIN